MTRTRPGGRCGSRSSDSVPSGRSVPSTTSSARLIAGPLNYPHFTGNGALPPGHSGGRPNRRGNPDPVSDSIGPGLVACRPGRPRAIDRAGREPAGQPPGRGPGERGGVVIAQRVGLPGGRVVGRRRLGGGEGSPGPGRRRGAVPAAGALAGGAGGAVEAVGVLPRRGGVKRLLTRRLDRRRKPIGAW